MVCLINNNLNSCTKISIAERANQGVSFFSLASSCLTTPAFYKFKKTYAMRLNYFFLKRRFTQQKDRRTKQPCRLVKSHTFPCAQDVWVKFYNKKCEMKNVKQINGSNTSKLIKMNFEWSFASETGFFLIKSLK